MHYMTTSYLSNRIYYYYFYLYKKIQSITIQWVLIKWLYNCII